MKHFWKSCFSLFLLVAVILSATSCSLYSGLLRVTTEETTATAAPEGTTASGGGGGSRPSTTTPSDPLAYQLTQEDQVQFLADLDAALALTLKGVDPTAIELAWEKIEKQYYYIVSQANVAYILYCCDLKNTAREADHLAASKMQTETYERYMRACRMIDLSTSPFRDRFFEDWSEESMAQMRLYSSEITELQNQNDELLVRFRELNAADDQDEVEALFESFVTNNNAIAETLGYDNFYQYSSKNIYLRDYGAAELEDMRSYVKTYLAPYADDAYNRYTQKMRSLNTSEQQQVITLLTENYRKLSQEYLQSYMALFGSEGQALMQGMLTPTNSVFSNGQNAQEGAFTTYFYDSDRPFCYFSPSYQDTLTVIHEMGHYYSACYTPMDLLNLELAETQSQANELLFLAHMEKYLTPEVYETVIAYQMYDSIAIIVTAVIVDEFESYVYANFDQIQAQGLDLDDVMHTICEEYGGVSFIERWVTDIDIYWRAVLLESPVYYISYATSLVTSIELYYLAEEDFSSALQIYRNLTEAVDVDKSYLELITMYGLKGPFSSEPYHEIVFGN